MIKAHTLISSDGSETGALLTAYLRDRGVYDPKGRAAVCYGLSDRGSGPSLNGNCQSDKITRMRAMAKAGVSLVPWTNDIDEAAKMQFPLFARKTYGMGAKDLMPVFQPEELPWRKAAGWTWFSSIIPIERELRLWVWRGEILDVVEKVMMRPKDFTGMGRNFGQGFDFQYYLGGGRKLHDAGEQAASATAALGLDFAAIDLIVGKDNGTYVLEANTAPGVLRSKMERTLAKLADRIADWARNDCPDWRR